MACAVCGQATNGAIMAGQYGESSVEDILESIKKVIARDNRETAAQARDSVAAQPRIRAASVQGHSPAAPAATVAATPPEEDILELDDAQRADENGDGMMDDGEQPGLISAETSEAMRESLAILATLAEPGAQPQIVRSGETSLEGLVRDMLRPMLKEWLDTNLPPMVEGLVAREIERIVRKKG